MHCFVFCNVIQYLWLFQYYRTIASRTCQALKAVRVCSVDAVHCLKDAHASGNVNQL